MLHGAVEIILYRDKVVGNKKTQADSILVSVFKKSGVSRQMGENSLQELGHHGNHEIEKTNSFNESETQNGVGEELTTEGRVASNSGQKGREDETDTSTGTSKTNGS